MNYKYGNIRTGFVAQMAFAALMLFWLPAAGFGQTDDAVAQNDSQTVETPATEKKSVLMPVVNNLKGITIGMTADEVKDKLGKAKVADANGLYYVFSDEESMQITLDPDKKVQMIATIYSGEETNAPKYEDVFGAEVAVEKQPDGRIYKLVQYPDAGYWVAYNWLMVGDKPMTTVTMQKIN
ncbi:MAG: hypothetical protein M3209_07320 [Acidobacteriota bacterium]|nr:hypothetical protein [Acidobacteriota bacterium]